MASSAVMPGRVGIPAAPRLANELHAMVGRNTRVRANGLRFEQGGIPIRVCGVTYGPFALNSSDEPLPDPSVTEADFAMMRAASVTAIRIYHPPPAWFLDLATEYKLLVLLDVPCPKHLDFLESASTRKAAHQLVRSAVKSCEGKGCVLGASIGNEISPDIVRWYGPKKIARFLGELAEESRNVDADSLVTYASYPPTEYLELPFLDFVTFNVYLHDRLDFRNYLNRLVNISGNRPLVLGELGMDTIRHGEENQARFLLSHLKEASLAGAAGAFVFSWTDDWFTHGCQIQDWAFGLTKADRTPKPAYHVAADLFGRPVSSLLPKLPRVSVVVCSYNGAATLSQCLESLGKIDYPNYEVILVDDGSTDETPAICSRFPAVRTINQENRGLSAARNVGMEVATGEIIAYTDSDCFADPDWLYRLVDQLQSAGASAVGGPNLSPDDGPIAACVDASPGQPTHVLISDAEAEHIPGCNMAFRKEVLVALGGFDAIFRKAGDDVDMCWRLLDAGHKIAFAPSAFVWHHRRKTPKAYYRQQSGYGEAEAILARKHPSRFNSLGGAVWVGAVYGNGLNGIRFANPLVRAGRFGQGLFQMIYQPGPAHWAMLPSTFEWHVALLFVALVGLFWWPLLGLAGGMALLVAVVVCIQARQANLPLKYDSFLARIRIARLSWWQPLYRGWARYQSNGLRRANDSAVPLDRFHRTDPVRRYLVQNVDRSALLEAAGCELTHRGWVTYTGDGWTPNDLIVRCQSGGILNVVSTQEWYRDGWSQIAVRFRLNRKAWRWGAEATAAVSGVAGLFVAGVGQTTSAVVVGSAIACVAFGVWRLMFADARRSAGCAVAVFDITARRLGLTPHIPKREEDSHG